MVQHPAPEVAGEVGAGPEVDTVPSAGDVDDRKQALRAIRFKLSLAQEQGDQHAVGHCQ